MALLEVKNVSKLYSGGSVKALNDVSLTVEKGEWRRGIKIIAKNGNCYQSVQK